jgi:hypothetical protein
LGHGHGGQDLSWHGGTDSEDVEELKKRITEQKQQIEKLQESIKSRAKTIKKPGEQTKSVEELEEDLWENRELVIAKSEALKRDENDLKDRERRLHIERCEHARLLRSIETEDIMSFGAFPTMLKRYQLLRLQATTSSKGTDMYKAYDVTMLHYCLVKIHHLSFDSGSQAGKSDPAKKVETLEAIGQQCEAFKGLKHGAGFASLLDHFELESGAKYVTVWEWCEGDQTEAFLLRNTPMLEKEAKGIILQLISALRTAERSGFQPGHLDFKPSRLTFLRGGEVKINSVSFPQLRNAIGKSRSRSLEVPLESQDSNRIESQEADDDLDGEGQVIRLAGSLFFELLFARPPAHGDRNLELPENIRISPECRECLCRMFDRERRITVQDVYSDPFFAPTKRCVHVVAVCCSC